MNLNEIVSSLNSEQEVLRNKQEDHLKSMGVKARDLAKFFDRDNRLNTALKNITFSCLPLQLKSIHTKIHDIFVERWLVRALLQQDDSWERLEMHFGDITKDYLEHINFTAILAYTKSVGITFKVNNYGEPFSNLARYENLVCTYTKIYDRLQRLYKLVAEKCLGDSMQI